MIVRHWMSSPAPVLLEDTPVGDALRFLEARRARALGILGPRGLQAVIGREDLYRALSVGEPWERRRIASLADVRPRPLVAVGPDETLERALQLLEERDTAALAVTEGSFLLGTLGPEDVVKAFARLLGGSDPGARIPLAVPPEADLLGELRRRSCGLVIRGLAAAFDPVDGWSGVMRLRGRVA
jgi:CBS domain-containing protein